jgi:glycine cleavage system H protein
MAARLSAARAARQLTTSAFVKPAFFSTTPRTATPLQRRLFTVSAAGKQYFYTRFRGRVEAQSGRQLHAGDEKRAFHGLLDPLAPHVSGDNSSLRSRYEERALISATAKEKKYTEDHEWLDISADGKTATLGISEYAAKALGDVVYIELPQVDMDINAGDAIGAVESVKSASDILTPVSGKVLEVNGALEEKPAGINKDPEGEGWIAKLEIKEIPEGKMMSKEEYTAFTEDA